MNEEWRPVVGYEGLYEVSDQGRVRSLPRYVIRQGGLASGRPMRVRGGIRKLRVAKCGGYWLVSLSREGEDSMCYVHALVLEAFVGPRPPGLEVCHRDGDPKNANLSNLAYGSSGENKLDQVRHGTHPMKSKTHCPSGHPYDEANTYVLPSRPNARYCRACHRARVRNDRARRERRAAVKDRRVEQGR